MNADDDSAQAEIKLHLPVKRCSQEKNTLEDTSVYTNGNILFSYEEITRPKKPSLV